MKKIKMLILAASVALFSTNCLVLDTVADVNATSVSYNTNTYATNDGVNSDYYVYYSAYTFQSYGVYVEGITYDLDLYTYSDDSTATTSDCSSASSYLSYEYCLTDSGAGAAVYWEVRPFSSFSDYYWTYIF